MSLEKRLLDQEGYLGSAVEENKKALDVTNKLYVAGQIDYLEVSQIQNRLIGSEVALLDMQSKRLFNRVDLNLALGGGFEVKE